jgi:hypothetical protein
MHMQEQDWWYTTVSALVNPAVSPHMMDSAKQLSLYILANLATEPQISQPAVLLKFL